MRRCRCTVAVVWLASSLAYNSSCIAADASLERPQMTHPIVLFLSVEPARLAPPWREVASRRPKHRFYAELDGARSQAESWLNDAGFSLLEERDSEGRRTYGVFSNDSLTDWTTVRVHARVGRPQLSAGFDVHRNLPALGVTIPWERCTFELEGLKDHDMGWLLMGRVRWNAASGRLQYGVAIPMAVDRGGDLGVVLQLRMRLGQ